MTTLQLGILASGNGSNLQAILDAVAESILDADIKVVIADVPGAFAIERAKKAGVPTALVPHRDYKNRSEFDAKLIEVLDSAGAHWVILAGFMRVLSPEFIAHYKQRIVNIHPALLPAFPGLRAQQQALNYGVKVAGCTVHFVDDGVDTGPIVAQRAVLVKDSDTLDTLSARILCEEHQLLVQVLRWLAADQVHWISGQDAGRSKIAIANK